MRKLVTLILLGSLSLLALPAFGQDSDARFDNIVRAIDTIPSRASLDAQFPDAQERLMAAVNDTSRTSWEQERALSLLSFYPDAKTQAFLTTTLETAKDVEVRKMAVYTLGRSFGPTADDRLISAIRKGLQDKSSRVVEFALRGLRYVNHTDARSILLEYSASSQPRLASIAGAALKKHEAAYPPAKPAINTH